MFDIQSSAVLVALVTHPQHQLKTIIIVFSKIPADQNHHNRHVFDLQVIEMEVECSNSRPPGPDNLTGEEEVNIVIFVIIIITTITIMIIKIVSLPILCLQAATEKFLENVNKWRAARELKQVLLMIMDNYAYAYAYAYADG